MNRKGSQFRAVFDKRPTDDIIQKSQRNSGVMNDVQLRERVLELALEKAQITLCKSTVQPCRPLESSLLVFCFLFFVFFFLIFSSKFCSYSLDSTFKIYRECKYFSYFHHYRLIQSPIISHLDHCKCLSLVYLLWGLPPYRLLLTPQSGRST